MYIVVTFAVFQSRGTSPISILALKISHNGEAIDEATSLNIEELKLSIPGALVGFIFESFSCICIEGLRICFYILSKFFLKVPFGLFHFILGFIALAFVCLI